MELTYNPDSRRYVFRCEIEQRHICKERGFYWDAEPGVKHWYTHDPKKAYALCKYADNAARAQLVEEWTRQAPSPMALRLTMGKDGRYWVLASDDPYSVLMHILEFECYQPGKWYTEDWYIARRVFQYADEKARAALGPMVAYFERTLKESRAETSDFDPPVPDGMELKKFQRAGVEFVYKRKKAIIADDMGLGKTIEAIVILNKFEEDHPGELRQILVVAPKSQKRNWAAALRQWLTIKGLDIHISGTTAIPKASLISEGRIVVIHPAALCKGGKGAAKLRPELAGQEWDALIVDEVHEYKTAKSNRSKALRDLKVKHLITALSGTPMPNCPIELVPVLQLIGWLKPNQRDWFVSRFCEPRKDARGFFTAKGASRLDELGERLLGSVMIYRSKDKVLSELPPKQRNIVLLDPDGAAAKRERKIMQGVIPELMQLQEKLTNLNPSEAEYARIIAQLTRYQRDKDTPMGKAWHEASMAKLPATIEHIEYALDNGIKKQVHWGYHKDFVTEIYNHFKSVAVHITGDHDEEERHAADVAFRTSPDCMLIVPTIRSSNTGYTWTVASYESFGEVDWVPGNMRQAEDRLHRITQDAAVIIDYLITDGGIDSYMIKVLFDKEQRIHKLFSAGETPSFEVARS